MNKKDNFNKALFDMFGVGSDSAGKEPAVEDNSMDDFDLLSLDEDLDTMATETTVPEAAAFEEPAAPVAAAPAPSVIPETSVPAPMPVAPQPTAPSGAVTYLAPGTVMEGTLSAKGDVEVDGDFRGDISATGGVTLRSSLTGNITAARLDLYGTALNGDVHSDGTVSLDGGSAVIGNIFAGDLVCAGRVKGDLKVSGNTTLLSGAVVEGAISTDTIVIERGATASGLLTMGAAKK